MDFRKTKIKVVVDKRYEEIHGLRAVAAAMVIWLHAGEFAATITAPDGFTRFYADLTWIGSSGVTLFFIISGFLITGILIDTKDSPKALKNFYLRRALRIFPLYYCGLVFILFLLILFNQTQGGFSLSKVFLYHALYINNWVVFFDVKNFVSAQANLSYFAHLWSLAVEQQFYIFWPLCFLFLYRTRSCSTILWILGCLICLAAILRFTMTYGWHWVPAYTSTMTRMDALFMGAILALLMKEAPDFLKKLKAAAFYALPFLGIVTCAVLLIIAGTPDFFNKMTTVVVSLTAAFYFFLISVLVIPAEGGRLRRLLKSKPFQKAGDISYGLYVFSAPVQTALMNLMLMSGTKNYWLIHAVLLFFGFAVSYILASLSYRFMEKPIMRWKNVLAPYGKPGS